MVSSPGVIGQARVAPRARSGASLRSMSDASYRMVAEGYGSGPTEPLGAMTASMSTARHMTPSVARIEDYALIGDLQTAALVGRDGSIDWCCLPRFDSGACFAALLGGPEDGRWKLAPAAQVRCCTRRYREDTLILESVIETDLGSVRLIEFMPPRNRAPDVVRIVEGLDGEVPMRSELVIRFDFGRIVPWMRRIGHPPASVAIAGPDALRLRTPVEVHGENLTTISEFTIRTGERIPFVLSWFPSHQRTPPRRVDAEVALRQTEDYWLDWASSCSHTGDYHEEIHASLRVLKALTYAPTGGIVAAPTTSLPEAIGGPRNWDYRFCWLRDAALTLLAMLDCGYSTEAEAWRSWLLRAVAAPRICRSCTASQASGGWTSAPSSGCPASRAHAPSGSGTTPRPSCSSTCTGRSSTPCTGRACTAWPRTTTPGRS